MKYILEYLDLNAIQRSTEFVLTKLIEEPSYNFFNDPIQKQILNESWNTLIARLPDAIDEESKLERNLQKLAFKICNYHVIIPETTILDEDFVLSKKYKDDHFKIIGEVSEEIVNFYDKSQHVDNDLVLRYVLKLFALCCCISVPQPRFRVILEQNEIDKKDSIADNPPSTLSMSKYNNCSSTSKIHFKIVPRCDEEKFSNESLEKMFDKFKIDKDVLRRIHTPLSDNNYPGPGDVNGYICYYLLYPLIRTTFARLRYIRNSSLKESKYKNEVTINGVRNIYRYGTFFLLKDKGIFNAFENRNDKQNNAAFLKLADQVIYNLKVNESRIGFAIDVDCVLIVDINVDSSFYNKPNKIETIDEVVCEVPCSMRCFRFSESKYNVFCLLMMLLYDYFTCVNQTQLGCIDDFFKELELTESDISDNESWKKRFAELDWDSKYSNYHQNENGDYTHNLYPSIIFPQRAYKEIEIFNETSFVYTEESNGNSLREDYLSRWKSTFFKW
ncbi:uncharacterized protein RJT21DRAFT_118391 [Scheffersomyces amazonensis]|uniref:uncharacterized protein n=1 Tax=Scheffersomyces amazonensis TaxID=1078765 RepID=UPI00315DEDFE